ncbi:hypothetical protein C9J12_23035 [Photobacterium frigidiphilum]|uniref:Uncharacterized protein n=1 Tax=Photobacterium frigidiphilum TaxID=264736 RepID=A0A2T3J943_9GAMM|nr:hypothetical protein C9J12_23035 [Photobacterium frigidiphilum]
MINYFSIDTCFVSLAINIMKKMTIGKYFSNEKYFLNKFVFYEKNPINTGLVAILDQDHKNI